MNDALDMFDIAPLPANADEKASVERLAKKALDIQAEIAQYGAAAEDAQKRLNEIVFEQLPKAMKAARQSSFINDDKTFKVDVNNFVSGSLPKEDKERREKGLAWMRANGGEGTITAAIAVEFSRGDNRRPLLVDLLKANGFEFTEAEGINHSTLQAFARERLRKGETVDWENLGLTSVNMAKVTPIKAKKK